MFRIARMQETAMFSTGCDKLLEYSRWGRGAVGSAPRWHRGGRGFESHRLHQLFHVQKTANCYQLLGCQICFFLLHYTFIARINAGDGRFPFVNVQFSRNHRPIPIGEATYDLRPSPSNALPRWTPDRRLVFLPSRLADPNVRRLRPVSRAAR